MTDIFEMELFVQVLVISFDFLFVNKLTNEFFKIEFIKIFHFIILKNQKFKKKKKKFKHHFSKNHFIKQKMKMKFENEKKNQFKF